MIFDGLNLPPDQTYFDLSLTFYFESMFASTRTVHLPLNGCWIPLDFSK